MLPKPRNAIFITSSLLKLELLDVAVDAEAASGKRPIAHQDLATPPVSVDNVSVVPGQVRKKFEILPCLIAS
jgi:hypothetical protein